MPTRKQVLTVEDDPSVQEFYHSFLHIHHKDEFVLHQAGDGESALELLKRHPVDLMILDWKLPGMSGLDVLKKLRSNSATRSLLIFMVTAQTRVEDRVLALESGADDYLPKNFIADELLAHLHCLLRRRDELLDAKRSVDLEELKLDAAAGIVTVGDHRAHLFPKEIELLEIFLRRPNMVHTSAYLWDSLWGHRSSSWKETLHVHVSRLRRKLGPAWHDRIQTKRGEGYILNTPS